MSNARGMPGGGEMLKLRFDRYIRSNLNNYGIMQNKRNFCTDQRIIGKAFFKMFLLIPTTSEHIKFCKQNTAMLIVLREN